MSTESVKNLGLSSKQFTGSTTTYQLDGKVDKPTTASDEYVAVFDTNEDAIKDGGYTIADILDRDNHTGNISVTDINQFDVEVLAAVLAETSNWTEITTSFTGNWSGTIYYRIDALGFVHIKMTIANSSIGGSTITGSEIYNALPSSIRPSSNMYYPCVHGTEFDTGTLTIDIDGVVTFDSQTNSYENDDNVYLAEQIYSTD